MSRMFEAGRRQTIERASSAEALLGAQSYAERRDRRLLRRLDPEQTGRVHATRVHALLDEAGLDGASPVVQAELAALFAGAGSSSSSSSSSSTGTSSTGSSTTASAAATPTASPAPTSAPARAPAPAPAPAPHASVPIGTIKNLLAAGQTDSILYKLFTDTLAIPNFQQFCREAVAIFESVRADNAGELAQYIPELACVDPTKFAFALATVDGQTFAYGDRDEFCLQSCAKPFVYALACEEHGTTAVHRHVGREPSGVAFNAFTLNRDGKPHNPYINAGAFITHSLVHSTMRASQRMHYVLGKFAELAGDVKIGFDQPTYLSERETANKNYALAYFMKGQGALPIDWDVHSNLEVRPAPVACACAESSRPSTAPRPTNRARSLTHARGRGRGPGRGGGATSVLFSSVCIHGHLPHVGGHGCNAGQRREVPDDGQGRAAPRVGQVDHPAAAVVRHVRLLGRVGLHRWPAGQVWRRRRNLCVDPQRACARGVTGGRRGLRRLRATTTGARARADHGHRHMVPAPGSAGQFVPWYQVL